jgi:hypothetical protein
MKSLVNIVCDYLYKYRMLYDFSNIPEELIEKLQLYHCIKCKTFSDNISCMYLDNRDIICKKCIISYMRDEFDSRDDVMNKEICYNCKIEEECGLFHIKCTLCHKLFCDTCIYGFDLHYYTWICKDCR